MFADDTSVIISNPDLENYKNISSLRQLDDWFKTNFLSLNYNKTHFIQFRTINSLTVQLDMSYNDKYIIHDTNTRFLGISIDRSISWKLHTEGLAIKLSRVCDAIRSLRPFVSHKSLKMIYFAYFNAVVLYGIIFWGNSPHSISIFKLQKRAIRLITNSRSRDSCRELFKNLDILPFYSQLRWTF
jgi:hypothetical protein